MSGGVPSARKVPKGQVSWEKVKQRRKMQEWRYETRKEREREEKVVPDWMRAKKVVTVFLSLLAILVVLAYFVHSLRYLFPLAGMVIMIGSYVAGGGLSEWHSVRPSTARGARAMLEYRYGESSSNWDMIIAGFLIGGIVFLSGFLAMVVDMLV